MDWAFINDLIKWQKLPQNKNPRLDLDGIKELYFLDKNFFEKVLRQHHLIEDVTNQSYKLVSG